MALLSPGCGSKDTGKEGVSPSPLPTPLSSSSRLELPLEFSRSRTRNLQKECAVLVAGDNRSRQKAKWRGWGNSSLLSWSRGWSQAGVGAQAAQTWDLQSLQVRRNQQKENPERKSLCLHCLGSLARNQKPSHVARELCLGKDQEPCKVKLTAERQELPVPAEFKAPMAPPHSLYQSNKETITILSTDGYGMQWHFGLPMTHPLFAEHL